MEIGHQGGQSRREIQRTPQEVLRELFKRIGGLEEGFYPDLMETANAVLEVLSESDFRGIPKAKRQYYHINNPARLRGGVMDKKGLSPDLMVLRGD